MLSNIKARSVHEVYLMQTRNLKTFEKRFCGTSDSLDLIIKRAHGAARECIRNASLSYCYEESHCSTGWRESSGFDWSTKLPDLKISKFAWYAIISSTSATPRNRRRSMTNVESMTAACCFACPIVGVNLT